MLSHDSRLRCDLVDLYYKLYGSKRPTCLPIPELAGIMKPYKHEESKRKSYHTDRSAVTAVDIKKSPTIKKERSEDVIVEENLECINVEVVGGPKVNKKQNYNS